MNIVVLLGLIPTQQFFKFLTVGALGFVVNVLVVYWLRDQFGLYWAGAVAFVLAGSTTWIGNRIWTFGDRRGTAAGSQWVRYLGYSLLGLALYALVYGGLIALSPFCRMFPVLPVCAGSLVGLFANFAVSRRLVFR